MQTNKEPPISIKPTPPQSPPLHYERENTNIHSGPMFISYQRDDGYYSMIDINKITSLSCRGELIIIDFNQINMLSLSISEYSRLKEECKDAKINVHFPKMGKYRLD